MVLTGRGEGKEKAFHIKKLVNRKDVCCCRWAMKEEENIGMNQSSTLSFLEDKNLEDLLNVSYGPTVGKLS